MGEPSVVIAVSSPHRKEALEAAQYAIDTLKLVVPIWKKEMYEGGGAAWKENLKDAQLRLNALRTFSAIRPKAFDERALLLAFFAGAAFGASVVSFGLYHHKTITRMKN